MQVVRYVPVILGIILLSFSWLPTGISAPNERSRIYLAVSIIDHHGFSIDEAIKRFGPVLDRAERGGVSYTDKAPGSSFLAALVYGTLSFFTAGEDLSMETLFLLMRFGLMIPLTIIGFLLLRQLLRVLEVNDSIIDIAILGWLVASPVLNYGRAFYGHQIVAEALLGALSCLLQPDRKVWHLGLAWVCAGVAGLTEYQNRYRLYNDRALGGE